MPSRVEATIDAGSGDWVIPREVPADVAPLLPDVILRYEDAMRPASAREVAVIVGRLAAHYWQADRPPEHHRLIYEDIIGDLSDYPVAAVAEAADEWRRSQRWAPKVCELRALCDRIARQRQTEIVRLRFLAWCVETHHGRCPRLLRRIGDSLVDYRDAATCEMLKAATQGETEFAGGRVLVAPGAALVLGRPDPAIVAYRQRVRDILAAAGYSAAERLRLGDIAEERAQALADERITERAEQCRRQRVLRILLAGGLRIPEIEAGQLLELGEGEARALAEERARHAAAIAAAEAATTASGAVQ